MYIEIVKQYHTQPNASIKHYSHVNYSTTSNRYKKYYFLAIAYKLQVA